MGENKKVLISCVGDRDPFGENNTDGAIITAYKYFKPDIIYILPTIEKINSKSNTSKNAEETKEFIEMLNHEEKVNSQVFLRGLDLDDPRDYSKVKNEMLDKIRSIYDELQDQEVEYYYNISSGTPQMSTVWVMLKNSGMIKGELYSISAPRFIENPTPENRVKKIEMRFLEEDRLLEETKHYLRNYSFEYASKAMDALNHITDKADLGHMTNYFKDLFIGYAYWDTIKYDIAKTKIAKIESLTSKYSDYQDINQLLQKQVHVITKLLESKQENKYVLLDFYYNMKRRYLRKNYTDALARFWRIYEGCLYYIVREAYKIEPSDLNTSENSKFAKKIMDKYNIKGNISIYKLKMILEDESNKIYKKISNKEIEVRYQTPNPSKVKLIKILEKLRSDRNNSIAAHGIKPVEEYVAAQAITAAYELIRIVFDMNSDEIDDYCFNTDIVDIYIDYIKNI